MNLMNIMVALIITGATMSATVPNIIKSKDKAIAQNISNYEVQMNNAFSEYKLEIEVGNRMEHLNGTFTSDLVFDATTGFTDDFKEFAFNGKTPVFPSVEGVSSIDTMTAEGADTIENCGWNLVATNVEGDHNLKLTPDFMGGSKTDIQYNLIKPTEVKFNVK